MENVLAIYDKNKKIIYLTNERYKHILKHPNMENRLYDIRNTIANPLILTPDKRKSNIKYFYKYFKDQKSKRKFLKVIVKYLNGKGFIITAYDVEKIR